MPTTKVVAGGKVPSPLPSNTETVLDPALATARSGLPSLLKSPTATDQGAPPAAKFRAAWKVPLPLPSSTETVSDTALATARSGLPSQLMLPTETDSGFRHNP